MTAILSSTFIHPVQQNILKRWRDSTAYFNRGLLIFFITNFLTQIASGGTGIIHPGVKWRFKTQGTVRAQPIVSGSLILVGSSDGNLYALDKRDGSMKWKVPTGGPITGAVAIHESSVYFVSDDHYVYAADLATGSIKWKYKMNGLRHAYWEWDYYTAAPIAEGNVVWVGSGDGFLYALESKTGKFKWKFETTGRIRATPAITEQVVYLPSNDGMVYAINKTSGKLLWKFATDGASYDSEKSGWDRNAIYAPPIIQDSLMVIASRDGKTYAVDLYTHKERWHVTYGPTWAMSTSVTNSAVYIGWSDNNLLSSIDLKSGKENWKFTASSVIYTKPFLTDNEVLVASADNKLYCVRKNDGTKLWEYQTSGSVYSAPVVSDGVVFFGSDDGFIYALQEKARAIKAVFQPIINDPGLEQAFLADTHITPWLKEHGFIQLDTTSIQTFIRQRISDGQASVIVFAYEQLPASIVGRAPEHGLLRQYLNSGGKVVWFGNVPNLYTFDQQGKPTKDVTRGERLLGVKFIRPEESGNYYSKTTQQGQNLGLPSWKTFTYANIAEEGITPLAIDGFGRVTAWLKRYNDKPGSGFFSCRTWGWYSPVHDDDLRIILDIANYELE